MLSRRAFLSSASALLLSPTLPSLWKLAQAAPRELLLSPSLQATPDGKSTWFSILELSSGKKSEFPVPLRLGHSWVGNPADSRRGIAVESGGPAFCEIDLVARKAGRVGRASGEDRFFGGHADYSPDGKTLYLTEMSEKDGGEGAITIRDGATFREIGRIPTHGRYPHEMYVDPDGKSILVANLGHDPGRAPQPDAISFARVEIANGKLLDRKYIRAEPSLVIGGGPGATPELLSESSYYLQVSKTIQSDRKAAIVLHPHGQALSFWDLRDGYRLKRVLSFAPLQPIAFTLTADKSRIAVVLSDSSLVFLSRGDLQRIDGFLPQRDPKLRASTHLFNWTVGG